jgi:hypothetical protein
MARALFGIKTNVHEWAAIIRDYEANIGRPIDEVLLFPGDNSWGDLASTGGMIGEANAIRTGVGRAIAAEWSIPIFPAQSSFGAAANGEGDWAMRECGLNIANWHAQHMPSLDEIWIRIGWEYNSGYRWYHKHNDGLAAQFAEIFRHWVIQMRSASNQVWGHNRFRFTICPNTYQGGWNPLGPSYPGDAYVDAIGTDQYHNYNFGLENLSPEDAFAAICETEYSTNFLFNFADQHGKRKQFNEWGYGGGINARDEGQGWVNAFHAYIYDRGIHKHTYWEEPSAYDGRLWIDGRPRRPNTWPVFKQRFGASDLAGGEPLPPSPPGPPVPPPPPPPGTVLTGTAASETLTGGAGPDTILGEGGDDALFGGGGADILDPGPGAGFFVEGGADADTIVYKRGYGKGTFSGFVVGTDRIRVHGYLGNEVTIGPHTFEGTSGQIVTFVDGGHIWLPNASGLTLQHIEFADVPITRPRWGLKKGVRTNPDIYTASDDIHPLWQAGNTLCFLDTTSAVAPEQWVRGAAGVAHSGFVTNIMDAAGRQGAMGVLTIEAGRDAQVHGIAVLETHVRALRRMMALVRENFDRPATGANALPFFAPFPIPSLAGNDGERMVRAAYAQLWADPSANFHIVVGQTCDSDARDGTGRRSISDIAVLARRMAFGVARVLNWQRGVASRAFPSLGPKVIRAVSEGAASTLLTVAHDKGTALRLGTSAGDGRGWIVHDGNAERAVTAVTPVGQSQLRLAHAACSGTLAERAVSYCLYGQELGGGRGIYDNWSAQPLPAGWPTTLDASWRIDFPLRGTLTPLPYFA